MPRKTSAANDARDRELQSALFSSSATWSLNRMFLGSSSLPEDDQYVGSVHLEENDINDEELTNRVEAEVKEESVASNSEGDNSEDGDSADDELPQPTKKRKVAWEDEDDANTSVATAVLVSSRHIHRKRLTAVASRRSDNYQEYLQQSYGAAVGVVPAWADLDALGRHEDEDEDKDAILVGDSLLRGSGGGALPPNFLHYRWVPDINHTDHSKNKSTQKNKKGSRGIGVKAFLRTVFAEEYPLALVTHRQVHKKGNGYASVFQVGTGKCFDLENLFFENFPIRASDFLPGEKKFILGAHRCKHMYMYDMEASKEVRIPWNTPTGPRGMESLSSVGPHSLLVQEKHELTLVDTRTWRPVSTLRPPGQPGAFCAVMPNARGQDAHTVYTHGFYDGEVRIWDLRNRSSRAYFTDDGCINGTAIAASANGQYLACGSSSGVVNVYRARDAETQRQPRPLKTLSQLVTSVDCLSFSSTSEALVFSSKCLPDAVKIAHVPSMRVFSNFPDLQQKLGCVVSCTFSPNSGYLAVATEGGRVRRIRLEHYAQC